MATPAVALVPIGVTAIPAAAVAFTGSSTEYWALEIARAQDAERLQKFEDAKRRLRRRQRFFTWMYNILAVGELVYFIVGLYIVEWQVADLQENPLLGPGIEGVNKMGGTNTQRIVQNLQYWRLVSSLFYNSGAIHLTANLGMVWSFGHFLIRELSPTAVGSIFLLGGLAGLMVSVNVGAEYLTGGASIPAFAMAGAAVAMLVLRWRTLSCHLVSALVVCLLLGVNAFIGATPFVDNSGNTAGLVFGAVMGTGYLLVRKKESESKAGEVFVYTGAIVAVAVILAAIVGGLAGLQMDTPAAGCCNKWVCTPSSWWLCDASRVWPTGCTFTSYANGNTSSILTCPKGNTISVPASMGTDIESVKVWCETLCVAGSDVVGSGGDGGSDTPTGMSIRR